MHFSIAAFPVLAALTCGAGAAKTIFQGNSLIIRPSSSGLPADAKFQASNFYCYFTEFGYLSFGWWLPVGKGDMDHHHCKPHPDSYDWYEYSIAGDCSHNTCRVTVLNWDANDTSSDSEGRRPAFQERYVARMLDVGDGKLGDLALSYFDKPGGGFAVGTRRVLSSAADDAMELVFGDGGADAAAATDEETQQACREAFDTFVELQEQRQIGLNFTLENPCGGGGGGGPSKPRPGAGGGLGQWLLAQVPEL